MILNHTLEITRDELVERPLNPALSMAKTTPDRQLFTHLLERVGSLWGWDKRPKYYGDAKFKSLEGATIYLLSGERIMGYALTKDTGEIENFGLFPEYNGKGHGKTFLSLILTDMFKTHDRVWLTTRSTNHPKVLNFYQGMGMRLVKTERMDNDIISEKAPDFMPSLKAG